MLDSRMEWPYYLSKRKLVLFSEMDAFEFKVERAFCGYEVPAIERE
jgi:hypothetical protein